MKLSAFIGAFIVLGSISAFPQEGSIIEFQVTSNSLRGYCSRPEIVSSTQDKQVWVETVRTDQEATRFFQVAKMDVEAALASFPTNTRLTDLRIIVMLERDCRYKKIAIFDNKTGDKLAEFKTQQEVSRGFPWTVSSTSTLYNGFGAELFKTQIRSALTAQSELRKSRETATKMIEQ